MRKPLDCGITHRLKKRNHKRKRQRLRSSRLRHEPWLPASGNRSMSKKAGKNRGVAQLAARRSHTPEVEGSSPSPATSFAGIAQMVEQLPCKERAAGSIPCCRHQNWQVAQLVERLAVNQVVAGSIPALPASQ